METPDITQLLAEQRYDELKELALKDRAVKNALHMIMLSGAGGLGFAAAVVFSQMGQAGYFPLITAISSKLFYVRQAAAAALGELGDPQAVPVLVEALEDEYMHVRQAAAYALMRVGDDTTVEPLIARLRDTEEVVRNIAANALGEIGDARALPELERVAAQDTEKVSGSAMDAIAKIKARVGD